MRKFLLENAAATDTKSDLTEIANVFKGAMEKLVGPILIVIGAAAAIYAIYLGVMYAKAEDANKRKEIWKTVKENHGSKIYFCVSIMLS